MITRESIQERSYLIWEREGRPFGRHIEHWAQAEAELLVECGGEWQAVHAVRAPAPALALTSASKPKKMRSKPAAKSAPRAPAILN
jgi:hypothetical protein